LQLDVSPERRKPIEKLSSMEKAAELLKSNRKELPDVKPPAKKLVNNHLDKKY